MYHGNVFKARVCAAQNENVRSGNREQYQSDAIWWLRSPYTNDTSNVWDVYSSGDYSRYGTASSSCIRPALILPSDFIVSKEMLEA